MTRFAPEVLETTAGLTDLTGSWSREAESNSDGNPGCPERLLAPPADESFPECSFGRRKSMIAAVSMTRGEECCAVVGGGADFR